MKKEITNIMDKLNQKDIYSLLLFSLYKFTDIPEYSSLSELIYILDKPSFLNLCEYFGGQTITIPTIHDLEILVYSLLLYQYVDIEGMEYKQACAKINVSRGEKKKIKANYAHLTEVLKDYTFVSREGYKYE